MKTYKADNVSTAPPVSTDEDMLLQFRNRNLVVIGWVTLPTMLPMTIENFFHGRYMQGVFVFFVIVIGMTNSFMIRNKGRVLFPVWFFVAYMFTIIMLALTNVGANALYWFHLVFFSVYFLMERPVARIIIISGLIILLPYVFYLYDFALAIRFALTLSALCYFNDVQNGFQNNIYNNLTELTVRDPLTNAFNRRYMNSSIQNVIEESNRGLGPVSILLMDIDHFKKINDNFGHEAGDQVLKKLVDILHKRQRKIDYVFRTGGEEFVVMLRNTELKQGVLIAEEIRQHVENAEWLENQKVTVSIGVAQYITDESYDEWLKRADNNMYEAKNLGRNRVFPQLSSSV